MPQVIVPWVEFILRIFQLESMSKEDWSLDENLRINVEYTNTREGRVPGIRAYIRCLGKPCQQDTSHVLLKSFDEMAPGQGLGLLTYLLRSHLAQRGIRR
jgi:hypothetical protein